MDLEDGDQLVQLVMIVLILMVLFGVGVLVLAGTVSDNQRENNPNVSWELDRINDTHAALKHTGGDAVGKGNLTVAVDGTPTAVDWSRPVLINGEGGIVRTGSANRLSIFWQGARGDREVLNRWDLSNRTTVAGVA
jgi:hypothetical protein